MTAVGWLPADVGELFGTDAAAEQSYEVLTVDVPPATWISALETARDRLGCTYFDWLSAVDEPGTGFRVTAHVAALSPLRRLLLRTTVPHEAAALPSAVGVYAGAAWHERETYEMFGITFEGHPALDHLLLPENFEGHPLRKDFVLAARVAKAWPGAKEPGEPEHGGPKRRQMLPPGVPDPNEWGPLKGQLPPAPARPARGAGRAAGERPARPAGERPVRRTRSAAEGSASQTTTGDEPTPAPAAPRRTRTAAEGSASQSASGEPAAEAPAAPPRTRTAGEGSVSQSASGEPAAEAPAAPRRNRSAAQGSASQAATDDTTTSKPTTPRRARTAADGSASQRATDDESPSGDAKSPSGDAESTANGSDSAATGAESPPTGSGRPSRTPRSSDAPWHHARPAFEEPEPEPSPGAGPVPPPAPAADSGAEEAPGPRDNPESQDTPHTQAPDTGAADTPEDPAGGPR
ncbi:NADH-quinone oxidoreductase subunit C [Streptomyces sp. NRRL S-474]|uniref:NADH-quinone oxidoreductase subunit C n=1 Tax=Streptomyces sp. NRRL S-474 TaxID=1463909 RepID=UPI0004CA089E|nr:NADH-quinone oxidoreductase subunit C [Streptomyces sp. NRRL S-474]